jgi:hypothetical protein
MIKALMITGTALGLGAVAVVAGYYGMQAYWGWLTAGAKRPLGGPGRAALNAIDPPPPH